jgi:hypothetical protein
MVAMTSYSFGRSEDLLQEGVGDDVLDRDLGAGLGVLEAHQGPPSRGSAPNSSGQLVAPVA